MSSENISNEWKTEEIKREKIHFIGFSETTVYMERARKMTCHCGILCRDGRQHQGQFKTCGVIPPFMLHGDDGILLSTSWLQCWKSFLKKFASLTLSRLNFAGSGPALVLDSLFSEYIFQGFWTHLFLLGN